MESCNVKALSELDWYGLVNDGSAPLLSANEELDKLIYNDGHTISLSGQTVKELDAREFIRIVSDLAFERAYNYRFYFKSGRHRLALIFRFGCVEFHIAFTPTNKQPGDVVVNSRLAFWRHNDESADGLTEWECLHHENVCDFFRDAEASWSSNRYSRFCKAFLSHFLNFRPFTRGSACDCYYFTCAQV